MKAQLIKASGEKSDFIPATGKRFTLEELQKAVGGYIEIMYLKDRVMIMNEEAKLKVGMNPNAAATELASGKIGSWEVILGDIVLAPYEMIN